MKLRMSVYKEVHQRKNGISAAPLHEDARGDVYKCRMSLDSGKRVNIVAGSPSQLRRMVAEELTKIPEADSGEVSFMPPEGVAQRDFISVRNRVPLLRPDGRPVNKRYDSSGTLMVATPLPLADSEIAEFKASATD